VSKPTLRILHHLHRTGGTLISKCVASLPRISLLSEVHPRAPFPVLDPVFQGTFWLRLLTDEAAALLEDASFAEKIRALHLLASNRGDALVLRNWAYLDFFARPFEEEAGGELSISRELEGGFRLVQVVTVRHPVDQWLSWRCYQGAATAQDFTFAQFVDACRRFRDRTADLPVLRYEDFVREPERRMRELCAALELDFDPRFLRRWPYYHQITGDDNDRASGDWRIAPRPRRAVEPALAAEAAENATLGELLEYYGYGM
jgi:protein O-GlcNAc transferase